MGDKIHLPTTREELEPWLSTPAPPTKPPVVMLIRGVSLQAVDLSVHALNAARRQVYREVVWVKQPSMLLKPEELTRLFQGDADALAVALSIRGEPTAWAARHHRGCGPVEETARAHREHHAAG
jgi:hypothetical protein